MTVILPEVSPMAEDRVFTDADIQALFYKLPKRLQDTIRPPRKMSLAERIEQRSYFSKLESTISPAKYRRAGLTRGSGDDRRGVPPVTNRGGKSDNIDKLPSFQANDKFEIQAVGYKGKFIKVFIPKKDKSKSERHAFVDWVNFTFKTSCLPMSLNTGHQALSDYEYVQGLSAHLYSIFGFGVSQQRESGMNFYKHSFDVGENGWGLVCIGGQKDSCSVTIKGQGLMASKPGWEMRLFSFLKSVPSARITRIDLASDNYYSKVSMDDYLSMYHAGLFVSRGRAPNIEQAGNWVKPNGKGRTLYVGSRTSGKLLRIYEKGLQLANGFHEKFPNWIRVELELKNQDRIIPFDTLLSPGQYLAGAYPALANMHQVQERVETFKRTAASTLEKALEVTRHQFGRYIWTLAEYHGLEKAFELMTKDKEQLPKTLENVINFQVSREPSEYIHSDKIHTFNTQLGEIPYG